ncbi:MAG: hypothetical protein M3Y72_21550 [Acidobacteriota bacterium]|nr:hypothetical protein [Acidobacteriota bacterium]
MIQSSRERRNLTPDERGVLGKFAHMDIPLQEVRARLGGMLEMDFSSTERTLTSYFLLPNPGIRIGMEHIRNALSKHWKGEVTDTELSDWATMLLLNEAYEWSGPDEDEIAEMLHELSVRKFPDTSEPA